MPIAIAKDGTVATPVPADCRSLILRRPPCGAVAVPIAVKKRENQWLGEILLAASAEAEVRVARDPTGAAVREAEVRVLKSVSAGNRELTIAKAVTDENGVIVIAGLTGEELSFEARQQRSKLVGTATVRLMAGERMRLELHLT